MVVKMALERSSQDVQELLSLAWVQRQLAMQLLPNPLGQRHEGQERRGLHVAIEPVNGRGPGDSLLWVLGATLQGGGGRLIAEIVVGRRAPQVLAAGANRESCSKTSSSSTSPRTIHSRHPHLTHCC